MSADTATATADNAPQKLKVPLIVGMVAVGLGLGMAAGVTLVGPTIAKKMGKVVAPAATPKDSAAEHGEAADAHGEGQAGEGAPAAPPEVHLVENLVLNPAGSGGGRFLLFSLGLEVASPAALAAIKERDAELRDLILTRIGGKTLEELTEVSARDSLKKELEAVLAERFGKKAVKQLYFPQFVVQ
jgi:flagellar FliL protein